MLGAAVIIPYYKLNKLTMNTDIKTINWFEGLFQKTKFIINRIKYMVFRECRHGNLYLANIATSKEARGLGIGKLLMSYTENIARNQEFEGVSLLAKDENVVKFYEKLKYEKTFDKVLLGERIIKMVKPIKRKSEVII